ncbi:MAG: aldo/keto reductase, partial [Eubacteriales bacterium]
LDKRGIKLTSNQMHYSLLYRKHEYNGLLNLCKELDVTFLSYMTLAQGLLTGKYTPSNRPKGIIRKIYYSKKKLKKIQFLISKMDDISKKYDKTITQLAIKWTMSKGTVPIVGARKIEHITPLIGLEEWSLEQEDIDILDEITNKEYQDFIGTIWKS